MVCGTANSADPDQTAPKEQSDHGHHYLSRHLSPIYWVSSVVRNLVWDQKEE